MEIHVLQSHDILSIFQKRYEGNRMQYKWMLEKYKKYGLLK